MIPDRDRMVGTDVNVSMNVITFVIVEVGMIHIPHFEEMICDAVTFSGILHHIQMIVIAVTVIPQALLALHLRRLIFEGVAASTVALPHQVGIPLWIRFFTAGVHHLRLCQCLLENANVVRVVVRQG